MRFLIVGAGAIGGYFGGRLLESGADVTFLVRSRRAAELGRTGLAIQSRFGNAALPAPRCLLARDLRETFDAVLLSCKAYDLDGAINDFKPAVGPDTAILPLLNGMRHLEVLDGRFGRQHVLGGECLISATLDADGRVLHLSDTHTLLFGERDGTRSERVQAIGASFSRANFDGRASEAILQEMWEKWVFIAASAGITCLMRACVGDIVTAGAADFVATLLDECAAVATGQGFPPRKDFLDRTLRILTTPGSPLTASMLRDIERGGSIEAEHIIGDLFRRAGQAHDEPFLLLPLALAHLRAYEVRRAREANDVRSAQEVGAA
jgi:2-dehydropantoate 2-reductase